MALYVHISETCQRETNLHSQSSLVSNIASSLVITQNLMGFDFFQPTPFIKKSLGRSFRLIAYRHRAPSQGDELIVFLRVLGRGSSEYDHFLKNYDQNTENLVRQFLPYKESELQSILDDLKREQPAPTPEEPDEEERSWLYQVYREEVSDEDHFILETENWVRKILAPENKKYLGRYYKLLHDMITREILTPSTSNTGAVVQWEHNGGLGITYLYRADLNRLLLLEPVVQDEDVDEILAKYTEPLQDVQGEMYSLARLAVRSYPFLMVLDEKAWYAIQENKEANLALSPEEAELVSSIRQTSAHGEIGYPLFINGRAGSGKSTMLQYLAADYVDFALRNGTRNLPIYLTSSRELLERARETVRGLLVAHHQRLLEGSLDQSEVDSVLQRSFAVFAEFLYSLLPPDVQQEFQRDRYVNYAKFGRLWDQEFAKRPESRTISPDMAWHTIRSYIKGIRSSQLDEFGPEEFNALPRRRRSISEGTFKRVYEKVWSAWYKRLCEDEHYWDDQDLAARVLELGLVGSRDCAAVFCDEAQDFTPAELDIIFQLSVFGRRSLQPEELRRVPIVFAGDPLQTINPTGFRWETVKAEFHERFNAVLDPRRRAGVEMSYRELRFNYRSNQGIVRFCNLIQLVRAALLRSQDIHPQKAWWIEKSVQPVAFTLDHPQTQQGLQQNSEFVKLVYCEEGEETEYARADAILGTLDEEIEGVYRNVLGPTRAKGLEFQKVVVYRYGAAAPDDFARLLDGAADLSDLENVLQYEYFFNRLYVAVSRAKGQLIIIDTEEALRTFWRFATDPELTDRLIERAGGDPTWREAISYLDQGGEGSWSGRNTDPREQAEEYATLGRRKRDPYLLRQASLAYRGANNELEAGRCLALAYEFENQYEKAGAKYQSLALYEEAFRCYWVARDYEAVRNLSLREAAFIGRLESRAADFMASTVLPDGRLVADLLQATEDAEWFSRAKGDATWKDIFQQLINRIAEGRSSSLPWNDALIMFKRLSESGVTLDAGQLATIAYRASDYPYAIFLWDQVKSTEKEDYYRAKTYLVGFPQNLIWYARLKEHREILRLWYEQGAAAADASRNDGAVLAVVADAAFEQEDENLALQVIETRPELERLVRLLELLVKKNNPALIIKAALLTARSLVRNRRWDAAVKAAEDGDFSTLINRRQAAEIRLALDNADQRLELVQAVIEELAVSDELVDESPERQAPVTAFLHRQIMGKAANQERRISPVIAGAAIERAGKIVDALQFYEQLERDSSSASDRLFAQERLIYNREKHAVHLRDRSQDGSARQQEQRAQKLRKSLKLEGKQFPPYPLVQVQVATTAARPSIWTRGPFKIVRSEQHGKLRVEHVNRFETVTLDAVSGTLRGDPNCVELPAPAANILAWDIPDWGTTVIMKSSDMIRTIKLGWNADQFEVEIDLIAISNRQ